MPELFLTVVHEGRDLSPDAVVPLNPGQEVSVDHHDAGVTVTISAPAPAEEAAAPEAAPAKAPAKKTTAKKATTKK